MVLKNPKELQLLNVKGKIYLEKLKLGHLYNNYYFSNNYFNKALMNNKSSG